MNKIITQPIISLLQSTFRLSWTGAHGVSHWSRVRINGLKLAKVNGANRKVIELFAFFHDSQRICDIGDEMHGYRAAEWIETLPIDLLGVTAAEKVQLMAACRHHTDRALKTEDITIITCWDADALDLGRVGIYPSAQRMRTECARQEDFIEACYQRSLKWLDNL